MAADGSIIIDTRIQTEGLSKGLNTIKADKNYCSGIKNGRNSKKFISKADCNS